METTSEATAWYSQTSSTQTMRTWAQRITSRDELPRAFREVLRADEFPFPYTLYIPEDRFSLFGKRYGKLVCVFEDHLLLSEARGDQLVTSSCALDDVLFVMRGTVLLTSWLTIRTISGTFSLKFNTTNMDYFEPLVEALRAAPGADFSRDAGDEAELAPFDVLASANYKYMNYGRQSLRAGDTIVGMAYQPERCIRTGVSFFKTRLFRRYATSHLAVLTGQELILIKEPKATRSERAHLYGGVFTYIPRSKITNIAFESTTGTSAHAMHVTLAGGHGRVVAEFSTDNASFAAFRQLCDTVLGNGRS